MLFNRHRKTEEIKMGYPLPPYSSNSFRFLSVSVFAEYLNGKNFDFMEVSKT